MPVTPPLVVGLVLATGLVFGEAARRLGLPKVTGYIIAGLVLNPASLPLIPPSFPEHTDLVTDIALSFITFSVGGTLVLPKLRTLGKSILTIVVFEAEFALLAVVLGVVLAGSLAGGALFPAWSLDLMAFGLLLGALASPTDPSATLAVMHEYRARGPVASTIMGVAALDDAVGVMNYSLCVAAARALMGGPEAAEFRLWEPLFQIGGGVAVGAVVGLLLNQATRRMPRETEGALIVMVFAALSLCFGIAGTLGVDQLLATMTMGAVVVNTNPHQERIFHLLERYTEELIFVLFFTLSGMHLNYGALFGAVGFTLVYVLSRAAGKIAGTRLAARLTGAPPAVRRHAAYGLIPQGGIVIGLALMIRARPGFEPFADSLIGIVIGATVIHELVGPVLSKMALARAGEIQKLETRN